MKKCELLERLEDIEWEDFEVKSAHSEVPKSSWETVSAFSNTAGGATYQSERPIFKTEFDFSTVNFIVKSEDDNVVGSKVGSKVESKLAKELGVKYHLTENRVAIIEQILHDSKITIDKLSKKVGVSETAIENNIRKLKQMGLLKRIGSDKNGSWQINVDSKVDSKIDSKVSCNWREKYNLSNIQIQILELIESNSHITTKELSEQIAISKSGISNNLKKLKEMTILKRKGSAKNGSWQINEE